MSRKTPLASRSLEYRAPETPTFLKALQAQVASSQRYTPAAPRGELDSLVASSSSSSTGKRKPDAEEDGWDSDDAMHGATVVVLREGKHVSRDEAVRIKQQQDRVGEVKKQKAQNIAGAASAPSKKRRAPIDSAQADQSNGTASSNNKAGPLDDVKQLIAQHRPTPMAKSTKSPAKKRKPPGSGLSFTLDDE